MTWLLIKNYNNGDVTNLDNNNEEENNEDRYLLLECVRLYVWGFVTFTFNKKKGNV